MDYKKTKIAIATVLLLGNINYDIHEIGDLGEDKSFSFISDIFNSKYSWGMSKANAFYDNTECEGNCMTIVGTRIDPPEYDQWDFDTLASGYDIDDLFDDDGGYSNGSDADGLGTEEECASNPIMIASGNKIQYETDLVGKGEFPLSIHRTFNMAWRGDGIFGEKWISNFDYKLQFVYSSSCTVVAGKLPTASCLEDGDSTKTPKGVVTNEPDGRKILFTYDGGSEQWRDNKFDSVRTLQQVGANEWELKTEADYIERYDSVGKVSKRTNPSGISHTFSYTGNKLSTVTHSSGRKLDFTWGTFKVTKIADNANNEFQYGYVHTGPSGMLNNVIQPGTPTVTKDYSYQDGDEYDDGLTGININGKRYATFKYRYTGQAISSEHAGGVEKSTFSFGTATTIVTNPLGHKNTYRYETIEGQKKLIETDRKVADFCPAASSSIEYDSLGNTSSKTDWKGNKVLYNYSSNGQISKKIFASGTSQERIEDYDWESASNRLTKVTLSDKEIDYEYTADGRIDFIEAKNVGSYGIFGERRKRSYTYETYSSGILKKQIIDGPRTDVSDLITMEFDSSGNLTTVTNALGQVTTYSNYDLLGNVKKIVDANGLQTDLTYDAASKLLSKTVRNNTGNQTTSYQYNAFGQVTKVTLPDGNYITNVYSDAYRLTKTIDRDGNELRYEYNLNSDVISTKIVKTTTTITPPPPNCWGGLNPFSVKGVASIDRVGLCEPVITTIDVDYFAKFTEFDVMGRLHANIGNNSQNTVYDYDDNSNIKSTTDSLGNTTTMDWYLNQLQGVSHRDGGRTNYNYDSAGRVQSVHPVGFGVTSYKYDGFGDLVILTSPDTGTTTFSYNKAGHITAKTLADGTQSTYSYDAGGRITSETNGSMTKTYVYDSGSYRKGRLYYVNDNSGQTLYYYDKLGNITQKRSKIDAKYYNTHYQYDNMNRVTKITYPSKNVVNYAYNAKGQVDNVTFLPINITPIDPSPIPNPPPILMALGSAQINQSDSGGVQNIATNIQYKPFGPMKKMTHGNGAVRTIEYDLDYRPTSIYTSNIIDLDYLFDANNNITKITNNKVSANTRYFDYDSENRLLNETLTSSKLSAGDYFSYDTVGNRTKKGTATTTLETLNYTSNSNKLTNITNSKGVVYSVTQNANGQITYKDFTAYTYNDENRMSSSVYKGITTNYVYNALGQRVKKGTTHYLYNEAGQLIAEHNSAGTVQKEYIYLQGQVVAVIKNGVRYYVHNDHLGRAERITNQSKSTVWRASNYAFDRAVNTNTIGDYNLGFPGQYFDKETGTYYNYFRDYDPSIGRYLQSDPIGLAGGINTYVYASSNPINRYDRFGLKDCDNSDKESFADCVKRCIQQNYGQSYVVAGYLNPLSVLGLAASGFGADRARALRREGNRNTFGNNSNRYTGQGSLNSGRSSAAASRQFRTIGQFGRINVAVALAGAAAFGFQIGANIYCASSCASN